MGLDNSWLQKRNCGIHMTIRDVDCEHFDAKQMARDFHDMGVNFFSFFAGGYITTYPSKLPESRLSPFLNGQDVTGDIVKAAHEYGIKAIAMADLSILPPEVYEKHPDWAMVDENGKPYETISGMYTACTMGNYAEIYGRRMVEEILGAYDVDGMKFGGGSYGFNSNICHCENCRKSYFDMFGEDIPVKADWNSSHWKRYYKWRTIQTSKRVQFLHKMVTDIRADMPVMGNGVCFSDTGWTINSALDMESMAGSQDMIQVEAQTRYSMLPDMNGEWQSPWWTGEEAAYMTNVTERPVWIVVSYFKAWPWRRSAIDYAEQKAYLAQIAANGASPMVNLSGGPPSVHEDKRGFAAPTEIWRFVRDHNQYFSFDRSGAEVAFVYSDVSMIFYGKDKPDDRYLAAMRGYERALIENHIPFDIISKNLLNEKGLARYKTIILTNYACMTETEKSAVSDFVNRGGSVIATFETSLYDEDGVRRKDFLLGDLMGISYDITENVNGENPQGKQNYLRMHGVSPLFSGIEETSVIPIAGDYCRVTTKENNVPLKLANPFIVFPEGLSYTTKQDLGYPMAVLREHRGGGKTVYLSGQLDKMHHAAGFEEVSLILANAVKWTLNNSIPATCDAPDSVYLTLRLQDKSANVHMVNLSGGQRMLRRFVPVYDITVSLRDTLRNVSRAFVLSSGQELPITHKDGRYLVTLPKLTDYDVIIFE